MSTLQIRKLRHRETRKEQGGIRTQAACSGVYALNCHASLPLGKQTCFMPDRIIREGFLEKVRLGLSLERVTFSFNKCVLNTSYVLVLLR